MFVNQLFLFIASIILYSRIIIIMYLWINLFEWFLND